MVSANRGYPEGGPPSEDLTTADVIIMATDSEEDDEDNVYNGYEPLATTEDEASASGVETGVGEPLPPIVTMEETLIKEVWSAPAPQSVDIEMDSQKVDEVKQVMAGVTLPPGAIPEWANNIPEEQWKEKLISRLESIEKRT